jgi:DNA repair exonuclease SbcCD ATPase subunit
VIVYRLHVSRFGCFDDFEISFRPGLNVIKGPNGAGKSTLQQALLMALLEQPEQNELNKRYRSWGSDEWYRLVVDFRAGRRELLRLTKDFGSLGQHLASTDGRTTTSPSAISSFIGSALGTNSLDLFRSTAFVAQGALTDISAGHGEISSSLEKTFAGNDEKVSSELAVNTLEAKVESYANGHKGANSKEIGPIARLEGQEQSLKSEVVEYQQALELQEKDEEELYTVQNRLAEINEKLRPMLAMRDVARELHELDQERELLYQAEEALDSRLSAVGEAQAELLDIETELKSLQPVTSLGKDEKKELDRLYNQVEFLQAEKDEIMRSVAEQQPPPPSEPARISAFQYVVGGGMLFGSLIAAVGLMVLLTSGSLPLGLTGLIAGLLILVAGTLWFVRVRGRNQQEKSIPAPALARLSQFDEAKLSSAEERLSAKLGEFGCDSWPEFEEKWDSVRLALRRREQALAQLKGLLSDGKTKEDIELSRKAVSRSRQLIDEKMTASELQAGHQLKPADYQQFEDNIKLLEEERGDLENESRALRNRLDRATVSREHLLYFEEQLETVSVELEREQEKLEVYTFALRVMKDARAKTLKRARQELAPKMGSYLRALTLDHYGEVRVEGDLDITVRHPERPDVYVKPEELSQGARDQLYMATRLALIDLVFPETNPPIFLDDPFLKFDPPRKGAALELYRKIAGDRQLFLFTTSADYDEAGHLIDLANVSRA